MERLDMMYRRLKKPVDHERLLRRLIAEVNTPWFEKASANDDVTMQVVRRCLQVITDQQGRSEQSVVMNLIKASRMWEHQSKELAESPAKHLLMWNATLIQSALLDAFT